MSACDIRGEAAREYRRAARNVAVLGGGKRPGGGDAGQCLVPVAKGKGYVPAFSGMTITMDRHSREGGSPGTLLRRLVSGKAWRPNA